jgi:hypothetical protein
MTFEENMCFETIFFVYFKWDTAFQIAEVRKFIWTELLEYLSRAETSY